MLNKLKSIRNNEDGFTLIELLIVIVIIGILAAIAIPIFLNQQKAAVDATVKSDVRNTVSNVALKLVTTPAPVQADFTAVTVVKTGTNVVGVLATAANDGSYTVTGYNAAGNFKDLASAFTFTSATGQYK